MMKLPTFVLQNWAGDIGIEYYSQSAVVFFLIFSLGMIGIGIFASRYQSNEEEYFAAGRRAGILVIALSIFASIQSGWGMVGVTGTGYLVGIEYLIITATFVPLGFVISYWLLARKMRVLGTIHNAITVPDAMYYRFKDERVRLLGATAVLLGCMGYLAAQYAALGIIGSLVLPVGFYSALLVGLLVVGFYTVIGGVLAAIWSDAVQGFMMIVGALLTAFFVIMNYPGGTGGMIADMTTHQPEYFDFTLLGMNGLAAVGMLLSVVVINLTVAGQPHAITKFYMVRDVSVLRWGALLTAVGYALTAMYWVSAPFARAAVEAGHVPDPGNPDAALPLALIEFAPDIVVAFVLTAVIAAIMSTSNAFLNMGASAVVHDYFIKYSDRQLTDKQEVRYGQVTTLSILVVAFIIAASFPGLIFVLGAAGWAIFASVIFPCVAIAYNWKGATTEGALAGGGLGLGLTLIWAYAAEYFGVSLPAGILGGQAAMVVGYLIFVVISLATSTNAYDDIDEDIRQIIDLGRISSDDTKPEAFATDGGMTEDEQ